MNSGGCCGVFAFLEIVIETVLLALKVTSQLFAQLVLAHKSEFKKFAAVGGESTSIYKLVSSENSRIGHPMSLTISLMYIRNKRDKRGPRMDP